MVHARESITQMEKFTGMNEFRAWLEEQGFKISKDIFQDTNLCNWYAYRDTSLPTRECECNTQKSRQIIVRPVEFRDRYGGSHKSAEIEIFGQANGIWYRLLAYSLPPEEVQSRLNEIEVSLVAAWNALPGMR